LSASKSWDVVLLKGLPRTAPPTLELLNAAGDFTLETLPVAAIEMEGRSWERYLEQKGRNLRQQIQRAEKRSKDVRVTSERGLDPDQVDVAMDRVVRIGLRSWKGSTDEAIASNAHVERFYRQVAKRMNQLRRLEIETLFAGSRPVAYVFGLAHGRDYFHIDTAYDESFKESSPGTLLNLALIKRLFREGYRRYVNEGEDAYKDRWTTDTLDLCTVRILGPSLRSRLSRFIREEAAPAARWLKGRLLR
jgi:CelD/BcsL family acetyltransferase involved in cellulose biosynthesis